MSVQELILKSLTPLVPGLNQADSNWVIFGSAALALNNINVNVHDIDILLSVEAAQRLEQEWGKWRIDSTTCLVHNENNLFRSRLSQYAFNNQLPIELSGGLEIKCEEHWQPVTAADLHTSSQGIRFCTLNECTRLLQLFNRPKDLERLKMIEEHLNATSK